jgi:hypothetical protein
MLEILGLFIVNKYSTTKLLFLFVSFLIYNTSPAQKEKKGSGKGYLEHGGGGGGLRVWGREGIRGNRGDKGTG